MTSPADLTLAQLRDALKKKAVSSLEATDAYLARIEKAGALNAFITVAADKARAMAKASDEKLSKSEGNSKAGPLEGVPLGIKDLFCTEDLLTTAGSHILDGFHPKYESTVTRRLWRDGAVCLGKLNMDEFAMGSSNETSFYGPVVNPWRGKGSDAKLAPGGSSGGSSGFVGALVNGFSQIDEPETAVYYDLPQYRPFWSVLESLDVPFYLHPRNPLPSMAQIYEGHPWLLGPTWAFGQETAVHALRLMCSGLFDEHPRIQIVLGHMGEGLPYSMWRIDNRNAWTGAAPRYPAKRKIAEYFQENFYLTTSGNFRTQTLIDAILEIGSDRILFSADWPFENIDHAAVWFDDCTISEADRQKIGRDNSVRLFKLANR